MGKSLYQLVKYSALPAYNMMAKVDGLDLSALILKMALTIIGILAYMFKLQYMCYLK